MSGNCDRLVLHYFFQDRSGFHMHVEYSRSERIHPCNSYFFMNKLNLSFVPIPLHQRGRMSRRTNNQNTRIGSNVHRSAAERRQELCDILTEALEITRQLETETLDSSTTHSNQPVPALDVSRTSTYTTADEELTTLTTTTEPAQEEEEEEAKQSTNEEEEEEKCQEDAYLPSFHKENEP